MCHERKRKNLKFVKDFYSSDKTSSPRGQKTIARKWFGGKDGRKEEKRVPNHRPPHFDRRKSQSQSIKALK